MFDYIKNALAGGTPRRKLPSRLTTPASTPPPSPRGRGAASSASAPGTSSGGRLVKYCPDSLEMFDGTKLGDTDYWGTPVLVTSDTFDSSKTSVDKLWKELINDNPDCDKFGYIQRTENGGERYHPHLEATLNHNAIDGVDTPV